MTTVKTTIYAFGAYLFLTGLVLLAYPTVLGTALGAPLEAAPWLRLLGVALWALAYYYVRAAGSNNRDFYTWSVHVRVGQFILLIGLVTLDLITPLILIFSGLEFATAVWTWFSLQEPTSPSTIER